MKEIVHIVLNNGPTNMGFNDFYKNTQESDLLIFEQVNSVEKSSFENGINFLKHLYKIRDTYKIYHIHSHILCFITCLFFLFVRPTNLKKCLYTVHTSRNNLNFKNFIFYSVSVLLAQRVVYCGKSSENSFNDYISKATRHKQRCITNGVKVYPSNFSSKIYDKYIYVGRLIELKKIDFLVDNFYKYNHSRILHIIGDGSRRDELQENYSSEFIVFHGLKPRQFVFDQLVSSCVFISASSKEGLPVAALEASSFGLFLLLSDIPPHREISKKIPHCLLFKDEKEFKKHLQYLENKNKDFFQKVFSDNVKATFDCFSVEAMLVSYFKIYHEMGLRQK
ncbi:glycosyltransferase [Vibrio breoganii]|uniref:glycosyltransferase n=1 Tax=Vibrio breoganii TaxID=553239 RepID=UPI000C85CAE7|nr:glycosyltransferase [Vibrio breoganii]PMK30202.1 hypothetical protein BCU03_10750 [Vibrio breoganii]